MPRCDDGLAGVTADTSRRLAAPETAARHEQIGQRAGDKQAMAVLVQPAIAHLGKAEHPLDDPDDVFDPGPHFRVGAFFGPLDLIDNTAVAIASINERLHGPPPDRPASRDETLAGCTKWRQSD